MKKLTLAIVLVLALGASGFGDSIPLPQSLVITSRVTSVQIMDVTPPLDTNGAWRIRCSVDVPLPEWANYDAGGVQLRTAASSELVISVTRDEIETILGEDYETIPLGSASAKITQAAFGKWMSAISNAVAGAP